MAMHRRNYPPGGGPPNNPFSRSGGGRRGMTYGNDSRYGPQQARHPGKRSILSQAIMLLSLVLVAYGTYSWTTTVPSSKSSAADGRSNGEKSSVPTQPEFIGKSKTPDVKRPAVKTDGNSEEEKLPYHAGEGEQDMPIVPSDSEEYNAKKGDDDGNEQPSGEGNASVDGGKEEDEAKRTSYASEKRSEEDESPFGVPPGASDEEGETSDGKGDNQDESNKRNDGDENSDKEGGVEGESGDTAKRSEKIRSKADDEESQGKPSGGEKGVSTESNRTVGETIKSKNQETMEEMAKDGVTINTSEKFSDNPIQEPEATKNSAANEAEVTGEITEEDAEKTKAVEGESHSADEPQDEVEENTDTNKPENETKATLEEKFVDTKLFDGSKEENGATATVRDMDVTVVEKLRYEVTDSTATIVSVVENHAVKEPHEINEATAANKTEHDAILSVEGNHTVEELQHEVKEAIAGNKTVHDAIVSGEGNRTVEEPQQEVNEAAAGNKTEQDAIVRVEGKHTVKEPQQELNETAASNKTEHDTIEGKHTVKEPQEAKEATPANKTEHEAIVSVEGNDTVKEPQQGVKEATADKKSEHDAIVSDEGNRTVEEPRQEVKEAIAADKTEHDAIVSDEGNHTVKEPQPEVKEATAADKTMHDSIASDEGNHTVKEPQQEAREASAADKTQHDTIASNEGNHTVLINEDKGVTERRATTTTDYVEISHLRKSNKHVGDKSRAVSIAASHEAKLVVTNSTAIVLQEKENSDSGIMSNHSTATETPVDRALDSYLHGKSRKSDKRDGEIEKDVNADTESDIPAEESKVTKGTVQDYASDKHESIAKVRSVKSETKTSSMTEVAEGGEGEAEAERNPVTSKNEETAKDKVEKYKSSSTIRVTKATGDKTTTAKTTTLIQKIFRTADKPNASGEITVAAASTTKSPAKELASKVIKEKEKEDNKTTTKKKKELVGVLTIPNLLKNRKPRIVSRVKQKPGLRAKRRN